MRLYMQNTGTDLEGAQGDRDEHGHGLVRRLTSAPAWPFRFSDIRWSIRPGTDLGSALESPNVLILDCGTGAGSVS